MYKCFVLKVVMGFSYKKLNEQNKLIRMEHENKYKHHVLS